MCLSDQLTFLLSVTFDCPLDILDLLLSKTKVNLERDCVIPCHECGAERHKIQWLSFSCLRRSGSNMVVKRSVMVCFLTAMEVVILVWLAERELF